MESSTLEAYAPMQDQEHWHRLCEQAAFEKDPGKLLELVNEINRLLEEKEQRQKANRARNDVPENGQQTDS